MWAGKGNISHRERSLFVGGAEFGGRKVHTVRLHAILSDCLYILVPLSPLMTLYTFKTKIIPHLQPIRGIFATSKHVCEFNLC